MAVAAGVGGRFRVGIGNNVSVGTDSDVDMGVGLVSGCVGEASSKVGKGMVGNGVGGAVGIAVFGIRTWVGNGVNGAGTQADKYNNRQRVRKKRWNMTRL
jgi:hypothetical protein